MVWFDGRIVHIEGYTYTVQAWIGKSPQEDIKVTGCPTTIFIKGLPFIGKVLRVEEKGFVAEMDLVATGDFSEGFSERELVSDTFTAEILLNGKNGVSGLNYSTKTVNHEKLDALMSKDL